MTKSIVLAVEVTKTVSQPCPGLSILKLLVLWLCKKFRRSSPETLMRPQAVRSHIATPTLAAWIAAVSLSSIVDVGIVMRSCPVLMLLHWKS